MTRRTAPAAGVKLSIYLDAEAARLLAITARPGEATSAVVATVLRERYPLASRVVADARPCPGCAWAGYPHQHDDSEDGPRSECCEHACGRDDA